MSQEIEIDPLSKMAMDYVRDLVASGNVVATPAQIMEMIADFKAQLSGKSTASSASASSASASQPTEVEASPAEPGRSEVEAPIQSDAAQADALEEVPDESRRKPRDPKLDGPAVPIKKSHGDDFVICLEDGARLKFLKRHLRTYFNMSIEEYLKKWKLPADYPVVAPAYIRHRRALIERREKAKASKPQRRVGMR